MLQCDLDWLASGKGSYRAVRQVLVPHSVGDNNNHAEMLASSVAVMFAQLPEADRLEVLRLIGSKLAQLRTEKV